jgi:hypothetical protein
LAHSDNELDRHGDICCSQALYYLVPVVHRMCWSSLLRHLKVPVFIENLLWVPSTMMVWTRHQDEVLRSIQQTDLVHTAKYGTYTLMDLQRTQIVISFLVLIGCIPTSVLYIAVNDIQQANCFCCGIIQLYLVFFKNFFCKNLLLS